MSEASMPHCSRCARVEYDCTCGGWSARAPVAPGWYWFRNDDLTEVVQLVAQKGGGPLRVEAAGDDTAYDTAYQFYARDGAEWFGPLEAPT